LGVAPPASAQSLVGADPLRCRGQACGASDPAQEVRSAKDPEEICQVLARSGTLLSAQHCLEASKTAASTPNQAAGGTAFNLAVRFASV
jgi:hypothetical protein